MLLDAGRPIPDRFVTVADAAAVPDAPALIPLARLLREADALAGRNAELGVLVPSATSAVALAPWLDRLSLIAIEFPKFRDGRGFTIARTLRERFGFAGEIRAVGHVLPDQYGHALRCGVSTVELRDDADLAAWQAALTAFRVAYQADVSGSAPLSGLRRARRVA